jgi:hypothetical protein
MVIIEVLPATAFTANGNGPVVNIGNYNRCGAASLFILQTAGDNFLNVDLFNSPDGTNFPGTDAIGGPQTPGGVGVYEVKLDETLPLGPYLRASYSKGAGSGGTVRMVLCFPTQG